MSVFSPGLARSRSRAPLVGHCVPLMRRMSLVLVLAMASLLAGCVSHAPPPGITAVTPFDAQRYQGRWHELARLDHSFERGMTDVTADYTLQPDGSVRVVNRGFDPEKGAWREAQGRAYFTGEPTTGSLRVSFFWPFYGGYHIAALDDDYRWALVVGPARDYCWILARDTQLPPEVRDAILARASALGIDTSALIWVTHDRGESR